jgi:hypothetical protein
MLVVLVIRSDDLDGFGRGKGRYLCWKERADYIMM